MHAASIQAGLRKTAAHGRYSLVRRCVFVTALLLAALYLVALGHELLLDGHEGGHDPAHCGLCALMTTPSLVAALAVLLVNLGNAATWLSRCRAITPCGPPCRIEYRRGPPQTISL